SLEGESAPPLAYTDSEGIFSFPVSDSNKGLHLRIEADQYENFDLRVTPAKSHGIQDVRLIPKTDKRSALSGIVLDRHDLTLQGAKVTIDEMPGMEPAETSTDGIFSISGIPKAEGDKVRIRVTKNGYQPDPYTEDVVLGAGPPRIYLARKK